MPDDLRVPTKKRFHQMKTFFSFFQMWGILFSCLNDMLRQFLIQFFKQRGGQKQSKQAVINGCHRRKSACGLIIQTEGRGKQGDFLGTLRSRKCSNGTQLGKKACEFFRKIARGSGRSVPYGTFSASLSLSLFSGLHEDEWPNDCRLRRP